MIDKGETAEETAMRELKEETGLITKKIIHKNNWQYATDP